eukprot:CAMPEP_0181038784 /NCGR_PEP_ID=MMETSP1070-20121207/10115_1 /TAXON_ID=265543 /ORGANISM="Minutocellus polymorphus, Strain NH13" /LENGTH=43 /DNA_ID= /DNA_START= /DNA_END= /DNA_ORIENTATION=
MADGNQDGVDERSPRVGAAAVRPWDVESSRTSSPLAGYHGDLT